MSGKKSSSESQRASAESARKAMAQARTAPRRNNLLFVGGAALIVVILVVVIVLTVTRSAAKQHSATAPTDSNPAASTTSVPSAGPPWPAPADASAAVRAAGLPMLTEEGTAEHIHAHLDVRVNGQRVPVAPYIGIDQAQGRISPLHTHDDSGVVHIESPVNQQFTLGQFFSEWGVSLTADGIGGLRTSADHPLRVYVNGTPRTGDPAAITFTAHDEIAVLYGPQQESVPAQYAFPAGE